MNTDKLKGHIPEDVLLELSKLDLTPLQAAHFLAQCHHESAGFKVTVENLNYSAKRLAKVFQKYYKNTAIAANHAHKPELIGARVYADRMGNGDERSGDGFKRRGRGYIMCTGTDNQKAFFEFIGLPEDSDPALISDKYPLESAYWFFTRNKIWRKCVSNTEQCVKEVSRAVNGGTIGLDERIRLFNFYWKLLK